MNHEKSDELPSCSFWKSESFENSLPAIAKENRMNIEEVKGTMEFLDSIFGHKEVEKKKSAKGERKKVKNATPSLLNVVTNKVKVCKSKKKNEDHEFYEFINFLGSEHKKNAKEKSSVPGLTMEELCGEKKSQEATTWRQLKTIYCQRETNMFGTKAIIYWQIEKSSKYSDNIKKEEDSNIQYIPHQELEENDLKNQALQKFTAEVEEKDKMYTQTEKKNDVLPNQRLYKNQKENWILDLNPWLEEVEPWKSMEREGKCFSIKLIPHDETTLDTSLENKQKGETIVDEIFDRFGKKKFLLQSYLVTQEENLFAEIKNEAEKNYYNLTKSVSLSGEVKEETRICCKVYKKNHSCKRLARKEKKPQLKKEVVEENEEYEDPSLELYRKLKGFNSKVESKYSEDDKPIHPFFGDKGVISKQFMKIDKVRFSNHYKQTIKNIKKDVEKDKPIVGKSDKKRLKSKEMPITILPIAKGLKQEPKYSLDKETFSDLSWKVAEETQNSEEDDPYELKFLDHF